MSISAFWRFYGIGKPRKRFSARYRSRPLHDKRVTRNKLDTSNLLYGIIMVYSYRILLENSNQLMSNWRRIYFDHTSWDVRFILTLKSDRNLQCRYRLHVIWYSNIYELRLGRSAASSFAREQLWGPTRSIHLYVRFK